MTNNLMHPASCGNCGFTTTDVHLLAAHSCDVQAQGGRCEDFPCCGHEMGDCNGEKYGSDEAIKAHAMDHFDCEHEFGICRLEDEEPEDEDDDTYDEVAFTGSEY